MKIELKKLQDEIDRLKESERFAWKNTHTIEADRQRLEKENAHLKVRIDELEGEHNHYFELLAADAMAQAIDNMIDLGVLDARSAAADARLDYGTPREYKYNKSLTKQPTDIKL